MNQSPTQQYYIFVDDDVKYDDDDVVESLPHRNNKDSHDDDNLRWRYLVYNFSSDDRYLAAGYYTDTEKEEK